MKALCLVFVLLIGFLSCATAVKNNSLEDIVFIERQITFMDEIIKMHDEIKNIHVSLEKLYPITVINNGYFYVFDINEISNRYEFRLKVELPEYMAGDNGNMLASFPLEFYELKASAVIGNNILENTENHITVFHEFVHCFQWHNGEPDIRRELLVEQQERAKGNYSWELNYPFPYNSEYYVNRTVELSNSFTYENMVQYHEDMKAGLQELEFEYMIWQEWKEGFARYVENLIRTKYGLEMVTTILSPPFDRRHFYEIGSRSIHLLINNNEGLSENITELYNRMKLYFNSF